MSDLEWLTVPDFADRLCITATQVRELIREGAISSRRRGERNTVQIPAGFIVDTEDGPALIPTLAGTLTVLRDTGLSEDSVLEWLLTDEPELGMTPLDALRSGQRAHVRRLAQSLL
ncbi:MAG: Rv2175c family DNA-binding protein [Actinomycetota bacterium]